MSHTRRLGLGLGALLGGESESSINSEHIESVEVSRVRPNPFQPRADFDEEEIASLAESLKRQGVLQPVVVRPAEGGFYELVAGERR
ncbi:MAG: ParB N-terminal domain-containing protein, partial [Planctomycetota bacterium]